MHECNIGFKVQNGIHNKSIKYKFVKFMIILLYIIVPVNCTRIVTEARQYYHHICVHHRTCTLDHELHSQLGVCEQL